MTFACGGRLFARLFFSGRLPIAIVEKHADFSTRKTCLYDLHKKHGGKMVKFAGYSMPVQYVDLPVGESVRHTRNHVSIFDVSHMLQTEIHGSDRERFLESLTPADVVGLPAGGAVLSVLTNPDGGIIDDLILSKTNLDTIYVVSNAACAEKDIHHLEQAAGKWRDKRKDVRIEVLEDRALIAIQGPEAAALLSGETNADLNALFFMHTAECTLFGVPACRLTRCGYTGEDGFEVSVAANDAIRLVERLLARTDAVSAPPALAGLAARDALRLEAGLCLYGADINENTTPVEAALSFVVAKRRRANGGFPGAGKILRQLEDKTSVKKKRAGFLSDGRAPRSHMPVQDPVNGAAVGYVTSGCPSPTLGRNVAMAYVDAEDAKPGRQLAVDLGGRLEKVVVTRLPFVPSRYYTQKAAGKMAE